MANIRKRIWLLQGQTIWVKIPAWPLPSYVTLGKCLNFPRSQFSFCTTGGPVPHPGSVMFSTEKGNSLGQEGAL